MLIFNGIKDKIELENYINGKFEYRKNKSFSDVKIAFGKGMLDGAGKMVNEISAVSKELGKVLKSV